MKFSVFQVQYTKLVLYWIHKTRISLILDQEYYQIDIAWFYTLMVNVLFIFQMKTERAEWHIWDLFRTNQIKIQVPLNKQFTNLKYIKTYRNIY